MAILLRMRHEEDGVPIGEIDAYEQVALYLGRASNREAGVRPIGR